MGEYPEEYPPALQPTLKGRALKNPANNGRISGFRLFHILCIAYTSATANRNLPANTDTTLLKAKQ